jgi:hypothetical protein
MNQFLTKQLDLPVTGKVEQATEKATDGKSPAPSTGSGQGAPSQTGAVKKDGGR